MLDRRIDLSPREDVDAKQDRLERRAKAMAFAVSALDRGTASPEMETLHEIFSEMNAELAKHLKNYEWKRRADSLPAFDAVAVLERGESLWVDSDSSGLVSYFQSVGTWSRLQGRRTVELWLADRPVGHYQAGPQKGYAPIATLIPGDVADFPDCDQNVKKALYDDHPISVIDMRSLLAETDVAHRYQQWLEQILQQLRQMKNDELQMPICLIDVYPHVESDKVFGLIDDITALGGPIVVLRYSYYLTAPLSIQTQNYLVHRSRMTQRNGSSNTMFLRCGKEVRLDGVQAIGRMRPFGPEPVNMEQYLALCTEAKNRGHEFSGAYSHLE